MRSEPGRILFLLAHPDDEFACSVPIRAMARAGAEVHCAYLTDGGFGGQPVARRRHESRRVLEGLGVPEGRSHFLGEWHGFPDGALHAWLDAALVALQDLVRQIGPLDRLYIPAWEGGHQDHDAVHLLGLVLAKQCGISVLRQFPLYHGAGLPGPLFKVLDPLPANGAVHSYRASWRERVLAVTVCLSYVSQWRTWVGLLPFVVLHMLMHGTFSEQDVDPARVHEPPHPGPPLYERRGFMPSDRFSEAAARFLATHGLAPLERSA
ncbi:MAG TPA: PIG-L family deacetylase [Lysobacter sp.]|nr:PIG-L family deacetylase [Lysobacter sp.]